jgi:hypothetical protein
MKGKAKMAAGKMNLKTGNRGSMRRITRCMTCAGLLAMFALLAQQVSIQPHERTGSKKPGGSQSSPNLRVDSSLVLVPLTVTDKLGRTVVSLGKENFRVFDNQVEQSIS